MWQEQAYSVENTVMVHIRRIREKIEINPKEPEILKVVWGWLQIEKLIRAGPKSYFIYINSNINNSSLLIWFNIYYKI